LGSPLVSMGAAVSLLCTNVDLSFWTNIVFVVFHAEVFIRGRGQ
jgi:hypothetical protein